MWNFTKEQRNSWYNGFWISVFFRLWLKILEFRSDPNKSVLVLWSHGALAYDLYRFPVQPLETARRETKFQLLLLLFNQHMNVPLCVSTSAIRKSPLISIWSMISLCSLLLEDNLFNTYNCLFYAVHPIIQLCILKLSHLWIHIQIHEKSSPTPNSCCSHFYVAGQRIEEFYQV